MKKSLFILATACLSAVFLTSCAGNSTAEESSPSSIGYGSSENKSVSGTGDASDNKTDSILAPLTEAQEQLRMLNSEHSVLDNSVALKNSAETGRILFVEETDTLFWTDDKHLCQKTGGDCFTLADGKIESLNLLDGKLYFICEKTFIPNHTPKSKPYMLDLETGELTLLSDKITTHIYIQPERVFLQLWELYTDEEGKEQGRYYYYQCEPNGESLEPREDVVLCTNGDWYVTCEQEKSVYNIYYRNDKKNEKKLIATDSYLPRGACIFGDSLYYVEGSWGDILKKTALDGSGTLVCDTDENYIYDFTFMEGTLAILGDAGFGAVNEDMIWKSSYIVYDDNDPKFHYSVYNYNNNIIRTSRRYPNQRFGRLREP